METGQLELILLSTMAAVRARRLQYCPLITVGMNSTGCTRKREGVGGLGGVAGHKTTMWLHPSPSEPRWPSVGQREGALAFSMDVSHCSTNGG